jgi:hypothetical protein
MASGPHPPIDAWEPMGLPTVFSVFETAPCRWWISGGRALELHVGRGWRSHEDTDVGVVRHQARLVFDWLDGWEMWIAAGGALSRWSGRDLSTGENNIWVRRSGAKAWCLDLTVGAGTDTEWVYRRDSSIHRPWSEAIRLSPDGLPYLAPELQLLFKSKSPRSKDDLDAREVVPTLSRPQRRFLRHHLPAAHPWRRDLLGP